jgi:hypothetical protein
MINTPSTDASLMAMRVEDALTRLNNKLVYFKTMSEYAVNTPCSTDTDKQITVKFFNKKIRDLEESIRDMEIVRDHLANGQ